MSTVADASEIIIDPNFKAMIPPLSPDERQQLELNLVADGCRDPLVVWHQGAGAHVLLDGHNRFEICNRRGIPFETIELEFDSREDAEDWVDDNQLGRRNLTPDQMSLIRGRRYNRTKKPHGGERAASPQSEDLKKTSQTLAEKCGVSKATIERDGQFAAAVESLRPIVPDIEARVMTGDIPSRQAVVEAAREPDTAVEKLKPHVAQNSGDNEWYTPAEYLEAARAVMGGIDVDPASSKAANELVEAETYFTAEEDGLAQEWNGRVWMNPPYAQPLIREFCEKLVEEFQADRATQAIVLVNNATETNWFQDLAEHASAVCFPRGRVKFWHPDKVSAPLQGQAFIYIGDKAAKFKKAFGVFGIVAET